MEVDVTQGKERFPINGPATSACFQYVKTNVPASSSNKSQFMEEFAGCACTDRCDESSCPCIQLFGPAYDDDRRLLELWCIDENVKKRSIFECGDNCACKNKHCQMRVVQRGISEKLHVFPTADKGYGLQAVSGISRLSFVCEYAGEVVDEPEARLRLDRNQREGNMNYLIAVKESSSSSKHCIFVDPCIIGNIGRFINHSCDPNLIMIPVRVNHPVPRLALFSRRDISPGEELTFDYSGSVSLQAPDAEDYKAKKKVNSSLCKGDSEACRNGKGLKRTKCLCGSNNCSGYLPHDEYLFDR